MKFNRWLSSAAVLIAMPMMALSTAGAVETDPDPVADSVLWPSLKPHYFGEREIHDGKGVISLQAPQRAEDAAIVPISITDRLPADGERRIEKIWLFIDANPVPMSALFEFGPAAANASLATRVRVNAYTHMRAIAETSDGQLYMAKQYVKATGGCSAPASKDPALAAANLGKMRLRPLDENAPFGEPHQVQLLISHPNHTGLAMNQLTRLYTPAHFVNAIDISYNGTPVIEAEMTFSLSENPSLRFQYEPEAPGELSVKVHDTEDNRFTASLETGTSTARVSAE